MPRANYAMNLEGPNNVRDLGGYPTKDGKSTKWGQFLRSDNPNKITPKDNEDLYAYGVRMNIDLRSDFECEQQPSNLNGYQDVKYYNFMMMDNMNSNQGDIKLPDTMAEIYIGLIQDAQERYKQIFELIAAEEGCVLFNCTAGRDRTGTTAMLLLKLAGVPDEWIVEDYLATDWNIREDLKKMMELFKDRGLDDSMKMMENPQKAIEDTIEFFNTTYGTMENYLDIIGCSTDVVDALKAKLVE
ncbi:MAG: tyrosine-protein phosphatase [Eubacteriaceae bacterium]|nr:tyrosine-protein phosphatase [Eubacteriaceae bacterium]